MPTSGGAGAVHEVAKDDFAAWVGAPVIGQLTSSYKNGQWYACAVDFQIAGVGATEAEAYRNAAELVEAYLRSCFAAGESFVQARDSRRRSGRGLGAVLRRIEWLVDRKPAPWASRKSDLILPSTLLHVGH